jgi:hypothetical protein
MADNACKFLDIRLKTRFTLLRCMKIHLRHPFRDARIIFTANSCRAGLLQRLRLCDSVRLIAAAGLALVAACQRRAELAGEIGGGLAGYVIRTQG